jgi:hypothetical protein
MVIHLETDAVLAFLDAQLKTRQFISDSCFCHNEVSHGFDIDSLLSTSIDSNTVTFSCAISVPDSTLSHLECVLDKVTVLDFIHSEMNVGLVTFPNESTVRFFLDTTLDLTSAELKSVTVEDDTVVFDVTVHPSEAA